MEKSLNGLKISTPILV